MPSALSRRVIATMVAVAAIAVGLGAYAGGSAPVSSRPALSAALGVLPASTTAVGFTHWKAAIRGHGVRQAQQRDLMTRSVFLESPGDLRSMIGLRSHDIVWEAFARGPTSQVSLIHVTRGAPLDAKRLRAAGYRESSGFWVAGETTAAPGTMLGVLAWVPERRLLVGGTRSEHVAPVLAVLDGRAPSLATNRAARAAAEPLTGSASVLLEPRAVGCVSTRVDGTAEARQQVRAAEERFGRLVQYRYLGRGLSDLPGDRSLQRFVVAMPFDSATTASSQAGIRGALSDGPFIGRIGPMDEVLRLRSARSDGSTAVLTYDHPADSQLLMTGRGPLLPAAC